MAKSNAQAAKEAAEQAAAAEAATENQTTDQQTDQALEENGLGDGEKVKISDFDDFFSFDEDGKSLTGELMGAYDNVEIGEDGFTGYLFREYAPSKKEEDRMVYAIRSSWQLDKVFGAGEAEHEPESIYKIVRKGKKDLKSGRSVKLFNVVRYANPEFKK